MGIYNEDIEVQEVSVGKVADGRKYVASTGRDEIANDASVQLFFENPPGSTEDSYLIANLNPSADAEVEISDNVSSDGSGTALGSINAKSEAGGPPEDNVRTGDTYTVNGDSVRINLPGGTVVGGSGGGGGSGVAAPTTFLLQPGTSMLFELFNRSGGQAAVGISVTWFEVEI